MKKALFTLGLALLLLVAGCASLSMTGAGYDLGTIAQGRDSQLASTTSEVKDAWGQNSRVTALWQKVGETWQYVTAFQASGAGIGQSVTTAAAGTAPLVGAAPLIRPSNVTQTGGGGSGGSAAATAAGGVGGQGGAGGAGGTGKGGDATVIQIK